MFGQSRLFNKIFKEYKAETKKINKRKKLLFKEEKKQRGKNKENELNIRDYINNVNGRS